MGAVAASLTELDDDGDDIDLYIGSGVNNVPKSRHFTSARAMVDDARSARIWLGIHFRKAMEDSTYIGNRVVRLGFDELDLDH